MRRLLKWLVGLGAVVLAVAGGGVAHLIASYPVVNRVEKFVK